MEFSKEKVLEMAELMKLGMDDAEIEKVYIKVNEFCSNMEAMLKEDVTGITPYRMSTPNVNVFQNEQIEEFDRQQLTQVLNDFDGEYFVIKKVMENE